MIHSSEIITGEKIQEIADIYLGEECDFQNNPRIRPQIEKHKSIREITASFNNPKIVYFYTHHLLQISQIIDFFQNPFILISHNSDVNITMSFHVIKLLNSPLLINWYAQNVCFYHPKLNMVPIGLANSMWSHGNLRLFDNREFIANITKTNRVFFNFNISTNAGIRRPCYDIFVNKYMFLPNIDPINNLSRLSSYEFCISPEGNGADCHRLWESLYLNVVPIVLRTPFTETLLRYRIPLVVLDKWEDLYELEPSLDYNNYDFSVVKKEFTFSAFQQKIVGTFTE
jgi:hypothetical protein